MEKQGSKKSTGKMRGKVGIVKRFSVDEICSAAKTVLGNKTLTSSELYRAVLTKLGTNGKSIRSDTFHNNFTSAKSGIAFASEGGITVYWRV